MAWYTEVLAPARPSASHQPASVSHAAKATVSAQVVKLRSEHGRRQLALPAGALALPAGAPHRSSGGISIASGVRYCAAAITSDSRQVGISGKHVGPTPYTYHSRSEGRP